METELDWELFKVQPCLPTGWKQRAVDMGLVLSAVAARATPRPAVPRPEGVLPSA